MKLTEYITSWQDRQRLADLVGSSAHYIYQIETAWQGRRPSPSLAMKIERATGGAVSRSDLRPDIWPAEEEARHAA